MSALILNSASHLYRILKVYLTLALLGASVVLIYGLFLSKPLLILITFLSLSLGAIATMLWFKVRTRSFDETEKKPPILPASLMALLLPTRIAGPLLGDLKEDFYRLNRKYGRKPAAAWYAVVSILVLFRALRLYATLRMRKVFVGDFLRKNSRLP